MSKSAAVIAYPSKETLSLYEQFINASSEKAFDKKHRKTIRFNMGKYDAAVAKGVHQFKDIEKAKQRAAYFKSEAIENLPAYLEQFEAKITSRGAKVLWALDDVEALKHISEIITKHNISSIVKSKSMTTEELELNEFIEHKHGFVPLETDLGEYIVQMAGQKPYHIVTPCMHLSKEEIAQIFAEHWKTNPKASAEEIVAFARKILREKYTSADLGITGANFLIADTGSIALTENEGNTRLCSTFPKVHIVVAGIEKVLPELNQLEVMWPVLATFGTGQLTTVYNTVISGPRQDGEYDGPEHLYVILMDNGRSSIYSDPVKRETLRCIRCGACLNACPVYRNIGGHTYNTTYSGPIGAVITPHLKGQEKYKHLSEASSLCGACTEVCPVKIDLAAQLLHNRAQAVKKGLNNNMEAFGMRLFTLAMTNKRLMRFPTVGMKNLALSIFFKNSWEKNRTKLTLAPQSFTQLWAKQIKR